MPRYAFPLLLVVLLCAGDDGMAYLDPRPLPDGLAWRGGGELRADRAGAGDDGGSLAIDREALRLAWLAAHPGEDEFWPEARAARTDLRGDLRLGDGSEPTGEYLDAAAGATWRRRRDDGRILGLSAAATWSGRSDVVDGMRLGATAAAFARLPLAHPGDGLLLGLAYDSQSSPVLGLRVLPWAAWQGVRGHWNLLLGAPASAVTWRDPGFSATAACTPLPMLGADLRLAGPLRLLAEARFASLVLRPADAAAGADRLFLSQWEWSGGLRLAAGPGLGADLVAGWAAGRRIGLDQRLLAARRDGTRLAPEPFLALRGRWSF